MVTATMQAMLLDGYVEGDSVVPALFVAAIRRGDPVGRCSCGRLMYGSVDRTRRLTIYVAECSCGKAIAAPDGRLGPRDGRPRPATAEQLAEWSERDRALLGERIDD